MYPGERFNSISHLIGAVLALAGLVLIVVFASIEGDPWKIVSAGIYGASLFLLFLVSTLYHSFRGRVKRVFELCDYCFIYVLIAGSYTPLALVTLRGGWGWSLLGVSWGLAAAGIAIEVTRVDPRRRLSMMLYLLMGWIIVVALVPLLKHMPLPGFVLLCSGGVTYSVGIVFYLLDHKVKHFHGVWHLLVVAASICIYIAVFAFLD